MSIHIRSIVRSAAVSLALFALAACGGGGGSDTSPSAPPAPSTAARQVALTDAENTQHCQGRGGIKVLTGIDDNRDGDLDVPDEVDATEYVCNGAIGPQGDVGPQGNPGVDGTATVIIYFELGQSFALPEDAAAGDSAGTITAFTSNGTDVTFTEADSSSDAFDVSDAGEITLADDVSLDFETQNEYTIAVVATATDAPPAHFSVRIAVVDVEEPPLQDGTAANPYLVDTLAELQSIATGFQNEAVTTALSLEDTLAAHYRQTADIDASPTATWNDAGTDTSVYEGFQPIGDCGTDTICASDGDDSDATGDESADNVPFEGSFDGGGHLIAGLSIDRSTSGVGLFRATGSGSVLENVALVGVDLRGTTSGALVGYTLGTVRQSFATGRLDGRTETSKVGGLIGLSEGASEANFTAVTVAGDGGLIGTSSGAVLRSFALGSVTDSGGVPGGLIGLVGGRASHNFATGNVTGTNPVGLVGIANVSGSSISDSYALDTIAPKELTGAGPAARSYRLVAAEGDADAANGAVTEAGLRKLACADAIFEDGNGNGCDAFNENIFPWDFGTNADLPVINGLVGGLDAQGQRRAVEFSLVDRTATGAITSGETSVEVTLTAPAVGREAGSVLSYFWVLERSTAISADGLRAREVIITAEAGSYAAHLTIVERDAAGTLLAVYADEFTLTVTD